VQAPRTQLSVFDGGMSKICHDWPRCQSNLDRASDDAVNIVEVSGWRSKPVLGPSPLRVAKMELRSDYVGRATTSLMGGDLSFAYSLVCAPLNVSEKRPGTMRSIVITLAILALLPLALGASLDASGQCA